MKRPGSIVRPTDTERLSRLRRQARIFFLRGLTAAALEAVESEIHGIRHGDFSLA
jgi:hypothetical protein